MNNNNQLLISVKNRYNKFQDELIQEGYESVEDFRGYTLQKFDALLNKLGITTTNTGPSPFKQSQSNNDIEWEEDTKGPEEDIKQFMGIDVVEKTYGEGRDKRTYKNAKAFDGAAYMNISLPMGDRMYKLGAINLQDFSENQANDAGTRNGRARLLRLLQEHGLEKCSTIKFEIELNVSALHEHDDSTLNYAIENYEF